MPQIVDCKMMDCAYNLKKVCHALAITVGGGGCPECDTALKSSHKGGVAEASGKVGACKVEDCKYNKALECSSEGIHVVMHEDHAECSTYTAV
jgi:hypothetical protein